MEPTATPSAHPSVPRAVVVTMAVMIGVLLAIGLSMWAYFGKAVFFEILLAGLAACF